MRKLLSALLFLSMFVFLNANEVGALKEPTSEVKELIQKYKLKEVDFTYVKKAIGVGNRGSVDAV